MFKVVSIVPAKMRARLEEVVDEEREEDEAARNVEAETERLEGLVEAFKKEKSGWDSSTSCAARNRDGEVGSD